MGHTGDSCHSVVAGVHSFRRVICTRGQAEGEAERIAVRVRDHGDTFEFDRGVVRVVQHDVRVHGDPEQPVPAGRGVDRGESQDRGHQRRGGRPGARGLGPGRGVGRVRKGDDGAGRPVYAGGGGEPGSDGLSIIVRDLASPFGLEVRLHVGVSEIVAMEITVRINGGTAIVEFVRQGVDSRVRFSARRRDPLGGALAIAGGVSQRFHPAGDESILIRRGADAPDPAGGGRGFYLAFVKPIPVAVEVPGRSTDDPAFHVFPGILGESAPRQDVVFEGAGRHLRRLEPRIIEELRSQRHFVGEAEALGRLGPVAVPYLCELGKESSLAYVASRPFGGPRRSSQQLIRGAEPIDQVRAVEVEVSGPLCSMEEGLAGVGGHPLLVGVHFQGAVSRVGKFESRRQVGLGSSVVDVRERRVGISGHVRPQRAECALHRLRRRRGIAGLRLGPEGEFGRVVRSRKREQFRPSGCLDIIVSPGAEGLSEIRRQACQRDALVVRRRLGRLRVGELERRALGGVAAQADLPRAEPAHGHAGRGVRIGVRKIGLGLDPFVSDPVCKPSVGGIGSPAARVAESIRQRHGHGVDRAVVFLPEAAAVDAGGPGGGATRYERHRALIDGVRGAQGASGRGQKGEGEPVDQGLPLNHSGGSVGVEVVPVRDIALDADIRRGARTAQRIPVVDFIRIDVAGSRG